MWETESAVTHPSSSPPALHEKDRDNHECAPFVSRWTRRKSTESCFSQKSQTSRNARQQQKLLWTVSALSNVKRISDQCLHSYAIVTIHTDRLGHFAATASTWELGHNILQPTRSGFNTVIPIENADFTFRSSTMTKISRKWGTMALHGKTFGRRRPGQHPREHHAKAVVNLFSIQESQKAKALGIVMRRNLLSCVFAVLFCLNDMIGLRGGVSALSVRLSLTWLRNPWLKSKLSCLKSLNHSCCPGFILSLMSLLNISFVFVSVRTLVFQCFIFKSSHVISESNKKLV